MSLVQELAEDVGLKDTSYSVTRDTTELANRAPPPSPRHCITAVGKA